MIENVRRCCRRCEEEDLSKLSDMDQIFGRMFIVCRECGNKRCPKATWHENICTHSNDTGQPGSDY